MTAVMTGLGLGVERGSGFVLGSRGQLGTSGFGRLGENVTVNAATGNLAISRGDEILIGRGLDEDVERSYNSLGNLSDDNGDNWQLGLSRRVTGLVGTVNTTGSTVSRIDWDGSVGTYSWNGTSYVGKQASGSYDTLSFASNTWTWTDGDSRVVETYDGGNGGRLVNSADTTGNQLTFTYTNGRLTRVTNANGEYSDFAYSGANLVSVATSYRRGPAEDRAVNQLYRLFDAAFQRGPDTLSYSAYVNSLMNGMTLDQLTNAFYNSTEYQNKGVAAMTDGDYVEFLYQTVLRHASDAASKASFVSQLAAGTSRAQIFGVFSESQSHQAFMTAAGTVPPSTSIATRVTYAYDTSDRLTKVTSDLTPIGSSLQDGKLVATTYTYDGTSRRIASITQTGGAQLAITYDAAFRVSTLTQTQASGVTATTSFVYDSADRITTVTDPLGQTTAMTYDAQGQLTQLREPAPASGGTGAISRFSYTANGDVATVTDGMSDTTTYQYDANGNRTLERDAAGDTITRTFSAANRLLTETRYGTPDPDGAGTGAPGQPMTTRYAYDAKNELRYAIDAAGRVTEYQYDGYGERISEIAYTGQTYPVSSLATSALLSETTLNGWRNGLADGSLIQVTETSYDYRGNVSAVTTYNGLNINRVRSSLFASGTSGWVIGFDPNSISSGLTTGSTTAGIAYLRDSFRATAAGQQTSIATDGAHWFAVNAGERLSVQAGVEGTGAAGSLQLVVHYKDSLGADVATAVIGTLNGPQAFNTKLSGFITPPVGATNARLEVYCTSSGAGTGTFSIAQPMVARAYTSQPNIPNFAPRPGNDDDMTARATDGSISNRTTYVYDQAGKLLSRHDGRTIDETFVYDGLGRLIGTTDLTGGRTSIVFADGSNTQVVTTADGRTTTSLYDLAGELIKTSVAGSDGVSTATNYAYDMAGLLRMETNALGQRTYHLYDHDDRKVADILADGSITEYVYDAGDRLMHSIRYASRLTGSQLASLVDSNGKPATVDLASVRPAAAGADMWNWTIYDHADRVIETIGNGDDATVFAYDGASRLASTTRYANWIYTPDAPSLRTAEPASITLPTADVTRDRVTRNFYDDAGLLIGTLDGLGGFVRNTYDGAGQMIETTRYAGSAPVDLRASGTFAQISAAIAPTLADRTQDFVYGTNGLLAASLDAARGLTEYGYDGSNNLIQTTRYAAPLLLTGAQSVASIQAAVAAAGMLTDGANRVTRSVFDGANRLAFTIDAAGDVTGYGYDAVGRVVKQTGFAAQFTTTGVQSLAIMQSWASGHVDVTNDRVVRSLYDGIGRMVYAVDPEGYVTESQYDALGRVSKSIRHPTVYTVGDGTTSAQLKASIGTPSTNAVATSFVYDVAGRLTDTVDGAGVITRSTYDALGNVTDVTVAADTLDAATTHFAYDPAGNVFARILAYGTSDASATSYFHDAVGNLLYTFDGANNATFYTYDAAGRVLRSFNVGSGWLEATGVDDAWYRSKYSVPTGTTSTDDYNNGGWQAKRDPNPDFSTNAYLYFNPDVYAAGVNPLTHFLQFGWKDGRSPSLYASLYDYFMKYGTPTHTTQNSYDVFGNIIVQTDQRHASTISYFDVLDRKVEQVDPSGYVTTMSYGIGGALTSMTRYATAAPAPYDVIARPTLSPNAAIDETTSFTLDKLDRVVRATDAEGAYEQYTLDAFGNRVAVRNKLGGVTTNVFDQRGLLLSETLPQSSVTSDGTVQAANVTNTYGYGARGNRLSMVEAAGLTEQRLTAYAYDSLDRLISTTHAAVQIVGTDLATTTAVTPKETIAYDKRGNVIQQIDAGGAKTLSYYDDLNRKIAEVSAVGTLSAWRYDANGNVLAARTYGDAVTAPTSAGGTPPAPVDANNYRETSYTYDREDRVLTSSVGGLQLGSGSPYAVASNQTATVTNVYDAAGNLVQVVDGRGAGSLSFYDRSGRRIAAVDASNYLTSYTLDDDGNVILEERFATQLTATVTTASDPAALRTSVAGKGPDRITAFTYDRNGRRLTEQRRNVSAWTVNAATGALASVTAAPTISYAYNGLGEVTRKTEATGDMTDYGYDASGRQLWVAGAAFVDLNGKTNRSLTRNSYDGLGDLVSTQVLGSTGTPGARTTTYLYGAGGRLASVTDAAGFVRSYGYDAAGRVVKESYARLKSDGTTVTEASATRYDLAGRTIFKSIATLSGSTWIFGDQTQMKYDAYGEVIARGTNALWQQSYAYDAAGRIWRQTGDDGTTQIFVRDAAGNVTLQVASAGAVDLAGDTVQQVVDLLTNNNANAIGAAAVAGVVATINTVDARGQVTQVSQPFRELSATLKQTLIGTTAYNAFGEVAQSTDARGGVTNYSYTAEGKVAKTTAPGVNWTAENGTVTYGHAIQTNTYDASGRLIGVTDANGNLNTRLLRAGTGYGGDDADVLKEFHADGGVFTRDYDVFGDVRRTTNEVGTTETYIYDAMDRLVEQDHQVRAVKTTGNATGAAIQLQDHYGYDGLGQRLGHWNSQLGATVRETSDYDAQGRVVAMVDLGGDTTLYGYVWGSSIATGGFATFGGWRRTTTNAAGLNATETIDLFGRTTGKTDFGGHTYTYTYDKAGRQLTQQTAGSTDGSTDTLRSTWYNSGLIASTAADDDEKVTNAANQVTETETIATQTAAYDAAGNRTAETDTGTTKVNSAVTASRTYEGAIATWDTMNRMTGFSDIGDGGTDKATIAYEYDLAGNVRHIAATYHLLDDQGNVGSGTTTQDDWYKYDTMNRTVLTQGVFTGTAGSGSIGLGQTRGVALAYDAAGERVSATHQYREEDTQDYTGGTRTTVTYEPHSETYGYTADGYLATVSRDGTTPMANYTRDGMGRVVNYVEYDGSGATVTFSRQDSYNNRSQMTDEATYTRVGQDQYKTTTHNDYLAETSPGSGSFTGTYMAGAVTRGYTTTTKNDGGAVTAGTWNKFAWRDDAEIVAIDYKADVNQAIVFRTDYSYDPLGTLASVRIADGRPRTLSFVTAPDGAILQRDEADALSGGDPREVYYAFDGVRVGDVSNNGTSDTDYAQSIAAHASTPGIGPFRGGAAGGSAYADFDQSYDPINGLTYQATATRYTVRDGDTLAAIAQTVWGDASLWYMLADANGLDGSETLPAGRDLIVPDKIANLHNTSATYRVYDPNDTIGNTTPSDPAPGRHHGHHCGAFGQILLVAVAVAVAVYLGPEVIGAVTPALGATGGAIVGGAITGAAASVASQGVGLATGIQDRFSFKGVALAAIAGGVGGAFGGNVLPDAGKFANGVARGVLADVAGQGIALATGLQQRFDWASVATAGLSGGVGGDIARTPGIGRALLSGTAAAIAGAGARSLVTGSDFGDTLMRSLPQVIGETIGNSVGDRIASLDAPETSMARLSREGGIATADSGQIMSDGPDIVVTARHGRGWRIADALGFHSSFVRGIETGIGTAEREATDLIARAVAYGTLEGGVASQAWSIATSPTSALNRGLATINTALQPSRLVAGAISLGGAGESIDSIQASVRSAFDNPADVIGDIAPAFFGSPLGATVGEGNIAAGGRASNFIGSFTPSADLNFGTTLFGNEAHSAAAAILADQLEARGVTGIIDRTGPGMRGVDISIDKLAASKLGFQHIEIKPNTMSGLRSYNRQVSRWGYDPTTVRSVTYDAQGNFIWGFDL